MRFDALPAATMYFDTPTLNKHTAVIFNIGRHEPMQGDTIELIKAYIEMLIEQYLQEREKKA